MSKTKEDGVLFLRGVPKELRAKYKAYCARRGRTMKDDFVTYMKQCARKDRHP